MNNIHFDVWPKVVRAGEATTIHIRPLYEHCSFQNRAGLAVQCVRDDGALAGGQIASRNQFAPAALQREGDSAVFLINSSGEDRLGRMRVTLRGIPVKRVESLEQGTLRFTGEGDGVVIELPLGLTDVLRISS